MSCPVLSTCQSSKSPVRTVRSQCPQKTPPDVHRSIASRGTMSRCRKPWSVWLPAMAPPKSCRIGNVLLSVAQPTGLTGRIRMRQELRGRRCVHRSGGGLERPCTAPAVCPFRRSSPRKCGRVWGSMLSRFLLQRFHWWLLGVTLHLCILEAYSNSTRYGAGLKEARRATLTLGPACAPLCLNALSTKRAFALSIEAEARIMWCRLQALETWWLRVAITKDDGVSKVQLPIQEVATCSITPRQYW